MVLAVVRVEAVAVVQQYQVTPVPILENVFVFVLQILSAAQ
jgi:hypothetical protein